MKHNFLKLLSGSALLSLSLLTGCGGTVNSDASLNQPRDTTKLIRAVAEDETDWTWFVGTDGLHSGSNLTLDVYFMNNIPAEVEHFQYFLDTDNNAATGFSFGEDSWRISGADYLIEDGKLYKSTSNNEWSWSEVGDFDTYTKTVEGDTAHIHIESNSRDIASIVTADTLNITIEPFDANWGSTYSTISTQAVPLGDAGGEPIPTKTLYEDFESGNMDKWVIDHDGGRAGYPPKMEIANGFDGSQYAGHFYASYQGSQNTYKLLTPNTKEFVLELDIAVYPESSRLSHGMLGLRIDTVKGPRLIYWDAYRNQRHRDANNGTNPSITYYDNNFAIIANEIIAEPTEKVEGLKYVHVKVDIDEYLQRFEPDNHVTRVYYFLDGQPMLIDNITLSSQ